MEPVRVDELQEREAAELDFPINPGTNEETALRFLAANPEFGWPPAKIADRTDINEGSVTKTMQRLYEKNLVDRISGRYFVNPELQEEITGLLGDLHNVAQSQAHPEQNKQMSDQRGDISDPHASEDEVDELLE
ncbi:MarR family transcriptional regulator [Halomicrobium sp. IBSBa]|uniref:MarR family transcriptional regulator n=1 Tax=Halomicrobium sp. IBSBa TaxID=2778916 RepID=UPI001ABFAD33|nr:helix-turn-helix domain-containing protein [Halomicrobium sp. IBSBa]MBO4249486.1 MarR family transcriptional regulator [Halomicrobium sp. IBSBa]